MGLIHRDFLAIKIFIAQIFFFTFSCYGQEIVLEKIIDIENDLVSRALVQDEEGNYVLTGWQTGYDGISENRVYVTKLNNLGIKIWEHSYKFKERDEPHAIIVSSNGDYIISGQVYDSINKWQVLLMRLGSDGELLWQSSYGGSPNGYGGFELIEDAEGNLYTVGSIDTASSYLKTSLYKISPEGNLIFRSDYLFPESISTIGWDLDFTPEGNVLILSMVNSVIPGIGTEGYFPIFIEATTTGELVNFIHIIDTSASEYGVFNTWNFFQVSSGYAVYGDSLVIFSYEFNREWSKSDIELGLNHSNHEYHTGDMNGASFVVNTTDYLGKPYLQGSITKLESDGSIMWTTTTKDSCSIRDIITTNTGQYAILGNHAYDKNLYFAVVNDSEKSSLSDQTIMDFDVFPSLNSGVFTVQTGFDTYGKLFVVDLEGRVFLNTTISNNESKSIELTNLMNGMYFLVIENNSDGFFGCKPIIILK